MRGFEATILGLMGARGVDDPERLDELLVADGLGRSAGKLGAILEEGAEVDAFFAGDVAEVLDLGPEERDDLARAVAYGQGREAVSPCGDRGRPRPGRPTPRASEG